MYVVVYEVFDEKCLFGTKYAFDENNPKSLVLMTLKILCCSLVREVLFISSWKFSLK